MTKTYGWARAKPPRKQYAYAHQQARAAALAALRRAGAGQCAEEQCIEPSRLITPDMDLHLCHDYRTGGYRGLGHATCNRSEAGRRARAWQESSRLRW